MTATDVFRHCRLPCALLVALSLPVACADDDGPSPVEPGPTTCGADVASVHAAVIAPSCLNGGCHNAADAAGGLDLSTVDALSATILRTASGCDRPLVVPGDPDGSFLYEKLVSSDPTCGAPMPLSGPLDAASLECVASWIASAESTCESCGGDRCVDTTTDPLHCGGCGVACPTGIACEGGACSCPADASACGDACVDTSSDPAHCGGCDRPCEQGLLCSLGSCKDGCDSGLTQCGMACADTTTSEVHCGGCDQPCGPEEVCEGGTCGCPGGADPQTDPDNCGSCGNVCSPGQSCVDGECTCASTSVSFSADVQPIFDNHCLGAACHGGVMPSGGLDLRPGASYGALVGVPSSQCGARDRVAPGDPGASYLLDKLLGVDLCFGSKMPKMGTLPGMSTTVLTSWICNGAPDD